MSNRDGKGRGMIGSSAEQDEDHEGYTTSTEGYSYSYTYSDSYENGENGENGENDTTFFYESAYNEQEVLDIRSDEPIILLTTYSDDSDFVPTMTMGAITSVEGNDQRGNGRRSHTRSNGDGIAVAAAGSENDKHEHDNGHKYEDGEEDEALVDTVAMNFDMGVSNRNGCCCFCRQIIDNDSDTINSNSNTNIKPTNEKLLSIAFVSFLAFTCCQAVAAYLAQSEAMMGDSAAMAVDAFTYAFNLIAERVKNNYVHAASYPVIPLPSLSPSSLSDPQSNYTIDDNDDIHNHDASNTNLSQTTPTPPSSPLYATTNNNNNNNINTPGEIQRRNVRSKRKLNLLLELIPPVISVTTLIGVTCAILKKAIHTLILDSKRSIDEQTTPNLILMLTFSVLNLVVDVVNVCFFARADHAWGYNTDIAAGDGDDHDSNPYDDENDDDEDDDDDDTIGYNDGDDEENNARMQIRAIATKKKKTKKNNTKKQPSKQNVIGLAKEKIVQTIKKERQSRRKGGAAYSHVAAMDSGSDEDYDYDHHDDSSKVTEDNMKDVCIEDASINQKMKAMIPLKGRGGGGDEKDLQRQSQPERKDERRARDNNNRTSSDSVDKQSAKHPLQINASREDEDEDEVGMVVFDEDVRDEEANLNMCSAYTHVFADTVRSIAVLIAAILAEVVDGITSEVADAAAAVAVSVIILLALIPLFVGIRKTWNELYRIRTEEAHERNEL